ncbi:MAG: prepilin-type N-terminal cleavage/methylation domain-containing protein [Planctomycetota bacterium]|nr:prepilin-type N-terminal cleavage/methylation domain-containing protein [Planctomycetota bacterium]
MKYLSTRRPTARPTDSTGFTLIEILIVLSIVSIVAAALGVTISNMMTNAREAQTTATLRKIDGLIIERQQGLQRAFEGRDFIRFVDTTHEKLIKGDPTASPPVPQLFGLSTKAVEAVARKDFARLFFPQRFAEMLDVRSSTGLGSDGIPDRIQFDDVYGRPPGSTVTPLVSWTGTPIQTPTNHNPNTESSELLYFALTRMEVFGVPLTAVDDFSTREVADTDNDGLPEFIDGWGNPLRFYRWPTRLFKPYGLFGLDGVPGGAGDDAGSPTGADFNDLYEIGWPGADDVFIPTTIRNFARTYIEGIPRAPVLSGGVPIPGDYDQLNIDPDDSFGILLHTAQPLAVQGINMLNSVSESRYHTLDTYHRPLVVSAGADGALGLYEPNHNEDTNLNGVLDSGEDTNGNGFLDIGFLGQPINEDGSTGDLNGNGLVDTFASPLASFDDLTNHNRRAGE